MSLTENQPEMQSVLQRELREKVTAFLGSESVGICLRAAADLTEQGGLALPYAYSIVDEGGTVRLAALS